MFTSPFTAGASASDVLAGVDLRGRRVLITGGASCLGEETARALVAVGADVTLAVRDVRAGAEVAERIVAHSNGLRPAVVPLNLLDPPSIDALARTWKGPLDILIANAGVMVPPGEATSSSWESRFATNFLGHFALVTKLRDALMAAPEARVLLASSDAHRLGPIDFDDLLDFERGPYTPWTAYARSSTALILFAVAASARWGRDGVTVNAYDPGIDQIGLPDHVPTELRRDAGGERSARRGAATAVFLASSPLLRGVGGRYFEDVTGAAVVVDRTAAGPASLRGVAPHAVDTASADRLWQLATAAVADW